MHIHMHMVRPVSLSDPAFAALREEKKEGESDSDVVLRLVREARSARKDPWHFVRTRKLRKRVWTPEEHLQILEKMREVDRRKAEKRWRERFGEKDEEVEGAEGREDEDDGGA